jgi:dihydroxyacetone kinase-like protein
VGEAMSSFTIDALTIATILKHIASDIKKHCEELQELDAKIGDGDLGVTIELVSKALSEYLASTNERDVGNLLVQCGMHINKANPSTFGTILASAFIGAGKAVIGKTCIKFSELALMGEGAIENIQKRGKAEVGGKTLIDTLVPAVNTFKKEIKSGNDAKTSISAAVRAAEEGMKATINMKAKFGRAKWFQNHSIGVQDGGATAMYYIIESFAKNFNVFIF